MYMPVYNHGKTNKELIDILLHITKNCKTTDFLFEILIVCVSAWVRYLLKDKKKIDKIIGDLEMMGDIGFKEMWNHIQYGRFMGLIELKDEELLQKDETISQQADALSQKDEELNLKMETIEKLLQYAPDDVKNELKNIK